MNSDHLVPLGRGLTEFEAQKRLKADGYNEVPRAEQRTAFRIILEVLREPMLALLLDGCFVYLLLGDGTEALILLTFAAIFMVITVIQETRTERTNERRVGRNHSTINRRKASFGADIRRRQ